MKTAIKRRAAQTICTFLFCCIILLSPAAAQNWAPYYERTPFLFAPGSVFQSGLLGYTNPALAQMVENDLRFLWNTDGRDLTSITDWGVFTGGNGVGFNVLHRERGDFGATDYRFNLAAGDRAAAAGLAYQWSNGDESAFGLRNLISAGAVVRPTKYISTAVVGNFPTTTRTWETVGELGIRPFGTPRLTLFADGALREGQAVEDMPWSVGAASEVIEGVDVVGRYFSSDAFTVGLTLNLGRVGAGSLLQFDSDQTSTRSTHLIRAGQYMPNLFSRRLQESSKYTSMELRGQIDYRERPLGGLFGQEAPRLYEILNVINTSADDPRVEVIALDFSDLSLLPEHGWEIRTALQQAQTAGKDVIIFIDNASMETYHLASVADHLVMDPLGTLLLPGYLSNRTYFAGTLEKLGIGFEAWRYFEYKSAAETFSRNDMSEADERQLQAYVDDQYELVRSNVAAARPITSDDFDRIVNERTLLNAEEAVAAGLADTLGRWEKLDDLMESVVGEDKGHLRTDLLLQDAKISRIWQAPEQIALVYALGTTAMDRGIEARSLHKKIRELGEDDNIRAIVFRVDSPGGDPLASDLVAEALREAGEEKPVIVSQGQVAASGGYWISMYGDSIVAGPNTVTGSIGVIGGWFYDEGFGNKLGMTSDHVQRGDHADLLAGVTLPLLGLRVPTRNLTENEEERVQENILSLYDTFVEKVASGRDTTEAHIRAVGEGRIYSGLEAQDAALVDIIGGITESIEHAREAAGIADNRQIEIVEVGHRTGLFGAVNLGASTRDSPTTDEMLRDYIQLFLQHQPRPLVVIEPGSYPWYEPTGRE